jgi:uncharacterized protein
VVLIRASEYRRMRWKNGFGETAEIAIAPAGAALEQFDWRISMARIEAAGPFSAFAGVDRTLTVLDGGGFRLTIGGRPPIELTPQSPPFPFAGEGPAAATLLGGPVSDLNVMARRDRFWHRVRRCATGQRLSLAAADAIAAVFCTTGPVRVVVDRHTAQLDTFDTLLIDRPTGAADLEPTTPGSVLLIEIGPR